jgi:hypothetical protein
VACAPTPEVLPPGWVQDLPEFSGDPGPMQRAHAHNDYYNEMPLRTALEHRFYSVEADVEWRDGRAVVAHYVWEDFGDFAELYTDRIAEVVRARGSVYGDGHVFTLWVDFKSDEDGLADVVHDALAAHDDVFTSWEDDDVLNERPVVAVLTGAGVKERYVERSLRYAIRDSNDFSPDDPDADARWGYYALNYGNYVDGPGGDPAAVASGIIDDAHAMGRQVRFYGAPDDEASWQLQLDAGADFVGTDRVADFAAAFAGESP